MSNLSKMCGEGSHPVCDGWGSHHFNHPEEDNGLQFTCACGCHYVPPYRGRVFTPFEVPLPDLHIWP